MTYDNKKDEQRAVDNWLKGEISIYSLEMAMIEFQRMRKLYKMYLFID